MRAQSMKLVVLLALLVVMSAGTALADDGQSASLAPVILDAPACTVVVSPGDSIQKAIVAARRGTVICVRGGVYNERLLVKPAQSGMTLMAYPGENPIIDGKYVLPVVTTRNKFPALLQITGTDIVIDGLELRNSNKRGLTVNGQNITLRNNVVRDSRSVGVNINGGNKNPARNILVENNVVYNNLVENASGSYGGSALTFIQVEDSIARGNLVYHNYGEGLVAGRWTKGMLFEGNVSYDNRGANLYLVNSTNPVVRNNFIFCTDDQISWRGTGNSYRPGPGLQIRDENFEGQSVKPPAGSGHVIINNIVVGCGTNFGVSTQMTGGGLNNALVANNSFINARGLTGVGANNIELEGRASYRNSRFVNNLIVQDVPGTMLRVQTAQGTPNFSTFQVSNNLYTQAPSSSWFSNEAGRVIANANLVNAVLPSLAAIPGPSNYALTNGSPAIDRGTAVSQVTHDYFLDARAGTPDIGADEIGGSQDYPYGVLLEQVTAAADAVSALTEPQN